MRLTKDDKEAFVRAVMDDVPSIDYNEIAQKRVREWLHSQMPEKLQALIKEFGRDYFIARWVDMPVHLSNFYCIAPPWVSQRNSIQARNPDLWKELEDLSTKYAEQCSERSALRSKVSGLISTCSTLNTAKARLPEFEKYLPADRDGQAVVNLPVANTVANLMAAGWPKEKAK